MLVIGLPEGMENVYYSLNRYFIYLYILGKFSEKYLASIEISGDISVIEDTIVFGMTLIFIERMGSSVGSGNSERERKDFKKLWIICIAGSLICMVFLFFLYGFLADFYIGDYGADTEEILYHAKYFLSAYALSFPLYIANHLFVSTYDLREMIWHMHIIRFLEFVGLLVMYSHLLGDTLGIIGIFIGLTVSVPLAALLFFGLVYFCYRGRKLPLLIEGSGREADGMTFDIQISGEEVSRMNGEIGQFLKDRGVPSVIITRVAFMTEEVLLLIQEKNGVKPVTAEYYIKVGTDNIHISIWDDGQIFDITDIDADVGSFQSYVVACIMENHRIRNHLTVASFNRNKVRIPLPG